MWPFTGKEGKGPSLWQEITERHSIGDHVEEFTKLQNDVDLAGGAYGVSNAVEIVVREVIRLRAEVEELKARPP